MSNAMTVSGTAPFKVEATKPLNASFENNRLSISIEEWNRIGSLQMRSVNGSPSTGDMLVTDSEWETGYGLLLRWVKPPITVEEKAEIEARLDRLEAAVFPPEPTASHTLTRGSTTFPA